MWADSLFVRPLNVHLDCYIYHRGHGLCGGLRQSFWTCLFRVVCSFVKKGLDNVDLRGFNYPVAFFRGQTGADFSLPAAARSRVVRLNKNRLAVFNVVVWQWIQIQVHRSLWQQMAMQMKQHRLPPHLLQNHPPLLPDHPPPIKHHIHTKKQIHVVSVWRIYRWISVH